MTRDVDPDPGAADLDAALREVPWAELAHVYGPAGDVPALLRAVIVGDDDVRARAWWELWGNIHHQGTVYEATVPAVPSWRASPPPRTTPTG